MLETLDVGPEVCCCETYVGLEVFGELYIGHGVGVVECDAVGVRCDVGGMSCDA